MQTAQMSPICFSPAPYLDTLEWKQTRDWFHTRYKLVIMVCFLPLPRKKRKEKLCLQVACFQEKIYYLTNHCPTRLPPLNLATSALRLLGATVSYTVGLALSKDGFFFTT